MRVQLEGTRNALENIGVVAEQLVAGCVWS